MSTGFQPNAFQPNSFQQNGGTTNTPSNPSFDAFQGFQQNAFQGDAGLSATVGAVFPAPGDVRIGIHYGPTGGDYTGTMVSGGGNMVRGGIWN